MNTTYLYLEYARVIKMCEGTDVKPWLGFKWKYKHEINWHTLNKHPNLAHCGDGDMIDMAFAVAILEGKPVFVGDEVYIKNNRYPNVNWKLFEYWKHDITTLSKDWTWTPPSKKRTFTLNGVELPCPVKDIGNLSSTGMFLHSRKKRLDFWFETNKQRDIVIDALEKILTEARDNQV